MKFACDGCGAQYMIADEKVGPAGVKVRCKKCSHVIVVKPVAGDDEGDSTVVMDNPLAGVGADDAGDLPFAGGDTAETDAELGAAFDSIFGEGGAGADPFAETPAEPPAPAPGDPFSSAIDQAFDAALDEPGGYDDHESTRVFSANEMAKVEAEKVAARGDSDDAGWPSQAPADEPEDEPADDAAGSEWYVAIDDEQVGPMSVEDVQARWEAGDISPDSLVWRQGMDDWVPLSTIDQLKHLIAPTPSSPRAAAAPEPEPAAAPPAPAPEPAEPAAPEWKPAAASLLASLAAEEMDALDKQASEPQLAAPSADPVGVGAQLEPPPEAAAPAKSALDIDIPPPPAEDPEPQSPLEAPVAPPVVSAPAPAPAPTPAPRPAAPAPDYQRPRAAFAASAAAPVGLTTGKLVALIGGSAGGVAVLLVGVLWLAGVFDKNGGPDLAASVKPVADTPAAEAPPAAASPAAAAPGEQAEASGEKAEAEAGKEEGAQAEAPKEDAKPEVAAKAAEPEKPKAEAKPAPKPEPKPEARPERRRRPRRVARRDPPPRRDPDPPARSKPEPRRSGGDDLFDDGGDLEAELFGDSSGGSRKPAREAPARPGRGYIPPAPGSGGGKDLPKSLGKGDILQVVARNKGKLKACADQQKAADPGASGNLVMSWRIRPNGSTTGVRCVTSQYRSTVMAKCLTKVIDGMKFPRYGGPQMDPIEFPFKF